MDDADLALAAAMADFINKYQDSDIRLISRFIFLAEGVDDDGHRTLHSICSSNMSHWDRVGMLRSCAVQAESDFVNGD